MMAVHRFTNGIAVCGTARGVNAADMEPPEITCRRCKPSQPNWWERQIERRDGRVFLAALNAEVA